MNSALLEILVENLPCNFVKPALAQLAVTAEKLLKENNLDFTSVKTLGTMQRLSLIIEGYLVSLKIFQQRLRARRRVC